MQLPRCWFQPSAAWHVHTMLVCIACCCQVMEAELTFDPQVRAAAPLVSQLDADSRLRTMLNLFMPQLRLESHAIKMQHNEGVRLQVLTMRHGVTALMDHIAGGTVVHSTHLSCH